MRQTWINVELVDGRHRARLHPGHLRPLLMSSSADGCTVGLVATGALLLGGDDVRIRVEVGVGARLNLRDIAGTVAYDGRGAPARWEVEVSVAEDAALCWAGEPFVVADGALVSRSLRVTAASSARVRIRKTLVLGRSGEIGGGLWSRSEAVVDGTTVYREDLDLLDTEHRSAPGMLGGARVVDSVLRLGPDVLVTGPPAAEGIKRGDAFETFLLTDGAGAITRFLGQELASSPVHHMTHRSATD